MNEKVISDALAKLGFGAVLAFSIRCARRVFPLTAVLPPIEREKIDKAIQHAELAVRGIIGQEVECLFASGSLAQDAERSGKIALANAILTATSAGFLAEALVGLSIDQAAHWAAVDYMLSERAMIAADLPTTGLEEAVRRDLEHLSAMDLGPNQGLDPSESGPLGRLWPGVPPQWGNSLDQLLQLKHYDYLPLSVLVQPGAAPPELINEFFDSLDSLYRSYGGSGLRVVEGGSQPNAGKEIRR